MENQMQVPMPPAPNTAPSDAKSEATRDVFINLAVILSFGAMVFSFISLLQPLLDSLLPDQFNCGCNFTWSIIESLATLVVSGAFYFYLSWKLRKNDNMPLHHNTVFHQVMVYLALFASGIVISYEIVSVLQTTFYYGFTTAVFLKLILFILILCAVAYYYIADIRKMGNLSHSKMAVAAWWVMFAVILGSIVGAFVVIGSPSYQKGKRFDDMRIDTLKSIKSDLSDQSYLPENLSDLYSAEYLNALLDPEYHQQYEYFKTDDSHYTMCATFSGSSKDDPVNVQYHKVYGGNADDKDPWAHEKGHQCFSFSVRQPSYDYGYGNNLIEEPAAPCEVCGH